MRSEESKGEGMENGLDDGEDSGEDSDATLPLPGGGPTDRPCLSPYPFDDSDAYSPTVEPGSPWEDAKPAGGPVDSDDEGPANVPCSWRGTAAEDLVNSVPPLPDSDDESEIDYVTPAKRVAPDDQVDESSMKVSKKAKVDAQQNGYIGLHLHIHAYTCIYMHIHTYTYIYIHLHTYIYIYIIGLIIYIYGCLWQCLAHFLPSRRHLSKGYVPPASSI